MKPILYNKSGQTVIGTLEDIKTASVLEERNGGYTASFTYPYVSSCFSQIDYDSIVLMKPNQKSQPQKFRVSSISKPLNGIVTYGCEHISYELNKNPIMLVSYNRDMGVAPGMLINDVLVSAAVHNTFRGSSDISVRKQCELDFMSARDAMFKIQNYFGGELEWDNNNVILHEQRGTDDGNVISYGFNLLDYTNKIDVSNVYTAIAPYMQITDGNSVKHTYSIPDTEKRYLAYPNASNYSYVRAKAVDLTDKFTEDEINSHIDEKTGEIIDEVGIINSLKIKAAAYMGENEPTDISQNVTLSYVDLRKAKEFAAIDTMNDLGLCDYVTIKDERLGVSFKGQVISTKFDVLTEMYDSIEIGNPTQQLLDSLASIVNFDNNSETIGETVKDIEKNLDEYFSEIKVTDNSITFKSGNIKDIKGVYNTYKYRLERDTDIQEEDKKGRIISFTDPQNRKTKIVRE